MLAKIISEAQSGAGQAALDAAIKFDIPHGGWIPKGRKTADSRFYGKYQLQEMQSPQQSDSFQQNVLDSDGTAILLHGALIGRAKRTHELTIRHNKPFLHVDLSQKSITYSARLLDMWLADNGIRILNIVGSDHPANNAIYIYVEQILDRLFNRQVTNR